MKKIQSYAVLKCYKESQIIVFNKRNLSPIFCNFTIPEKAEIFLRRFSQIHYQERFKEMHYG